MDTSVPLPVGTLLYERYRVTSVLGAGGFGITYCAHDRVDDVTIAIKEFYPQDWVLRAPDGGVNITDDRFSGNFAWGMKRFLEEAERLAQVPHPNIVQVLGVFEQNGTAYLLLSYEEGMTFQDWLEGISSAPNQTELDLILAPLLDALEVLHTAGFYHRDISPDNIVLRLDGSPVLLDFGAAREDTGRRSQRPTAIVKPGYSPPEQYHVSMSRQGPWTDIYALGATLYRAISGQPPAQAEVRFVSDSVLPAAAVATDSYRSAFLSAIDWALVLKPEDRPADVPTWRKALFQTAPQSEPFVADGSKSALANALPPGSQIDTYQVVKVLGAGGFGITYLAQDGESGERVALKEYFPNMLAVREPDQSVRPANDQTQEPFDWLLGKFRDEAASLARFQHPNIVRVRRLFRWNGTAYTVLDYLEGVPFQKWLCDLGRAPTQAELDGIARPLLEALETVHRAELLHRDISSANIMIRPNGAPVLFDFGAAKQTFAARTQTKAAVVTPGYAPFEQYLKSNDQQGPWTDIYATAATFYEAVTGDIPPESPARTVEDAYVPARDAALGEYRSGFLSAVDWGLSMAPKDRPQYVAKWRGELLSQRSSGRRAAAAGPVSRRTRSGGEVRVEAVKRPEPARASFEFDTVAGQRFSKGREAAMNLLAAEVTSDGPASPRTVACGVALAAILTTCVAISLGVTSIAQMSTLMLAGAIAWLGLEPFASHFVSLRIPDGGHVHRFLPQSNRWLTALFAAVTGVALPLFLLVTPPRVRLDGLFATVNADSALAVSSAAGLVALAIAVVAYIALRQRHQLALPALACAFLAAFGYLLVNVNPVSAALSDGDLVRMNGFWQLVCLYLAGSGLIAGLWGTLGMVVVWRRWRELESLLKAGNRR